MSRRICSLSDTEDFAPGAGSHRRCDPRSRPGRDQKSIPDQCKGSIVILRSIATKNLYKSIRRQILDCTAFVVRFFAKSRSNRHVERSETSATLPKIDSCPKRFLTALRLSFSSLRGIVRKRSLHSLRSSIRSAQNDKGLEIRTQPAGHARRQPDVCGPPPAKAAARTARKSRRTTQRQSQ